MRTPAVIEPRGRHTASVIFLHGLGDSGHGWCQGFSENISSLMPQVRFIFPHAYVYFSFSKSI
jgi:predicted esterase